MKYAKTEGENYRFIAEVLNSVGYKIHHVTIRNSLVSIMQEIAQNILLARGLKITEKNIEEIAANPDFQSFAGSLIYSAYQQKEI